MPFGRRVAVWACLCVGVQSILLGAAYLLNTNQFLLRGSFGVSAPGTVNMAKAIGLFVAGCIVLQFGALATSDLFFGMRKKEKSPGYQVLAILASMLIWIAVLFVLHSVYRSLALEVHRVWLAPARANVVNVRLRWLPFPVAGVCLLAAFLLWLLPRMARGRGDRSGEEGSGSED